MTNPGPMNTPLRRKSGVMLSFNSQDAKHKRRAISEKGG
jgi:hypothetical protein